MPHLLVTHGVQDFARWKALFDADAGGQREAGMRPLQVWRDLDDPQLATFLIEVADRARAEAFMARPDNARIGEQAGVRPPFALRWLEPA